MLGKGAIGKCPSCATNPTHGFGLSARALETGDAMGTRSNQVRAGQPHSVSPQPKRVLPLYTPCPCEVRPTGPTALDKSDSRSTAQLLNLLLSRSQAARER